MRPALCLLLLTSAAALQKPSPQRWTFSRRSILLAPAGRAAALVPMLLSPPPPASAATPSLQFITAPSGLQWADAKVGTGPPPKMGATVAIDYVMSTTGARYGAKIYGTTDGPVEKQAPYRWTLGDGSTIKGLEEAVLGGDGISAMRPGGVRRIIVPSELAYASLAKPNAGMQVEDCQAGKGVGPIPPVPDAFEEFQRFKNIYCNANRPYQPDLVMDIKLYGRRTPVAE